MAIICRFNEQVKCFDGVIRTYSKGAVFTDLETFRKLLNCWDGMAGPNGGEYHYWETEEQKKENNSAKYLTSIEEDSAPVFTLCHELHSGHWLNDHKDYEYHKVNPKVRQKLRERLKTIIH